LACIYKFQHTDRESGVKKTQIALGIVTHQHNCPETGNLLYDIRFCPPKGAKPAAKNRPDTLYQNICADMGFNIHFKSRIGKKVKEEFEDKYLLRSVMLAFNLIINKSVAMENFARSALGPTNIYSMSSYALAENVICEFYDSLCQACASKKCICAFYDSLRQRLWLQVMLYVLEQMRGELNLRTNLCFSGSVCMSGCSVTSASNQMCALSLG
jgi:hypothetical protein